MHQSIALIGLSGSGKSTVARLLAARLDWPWADTDAAIVARIGQPIAAFFAAHGEAAFRDLEASVLRELVQSLTPQVLATGGGIVLRDENRALLRQDTRVVWLDAPDTVLAARLQAHDEQRPLVASGNPAERIAALRTARAVLYRDLADHVIVTEGLTPEQVAARVVGETEK